MSHLRIVLAALALTALASCGKAENQAAPAPPATNAQSTSPDASPAQPAEETAFCAEVARRVTAEQCATYEALAASATRGEAAFNAPETMSRGDTHALQLAISAPPAPAAAPPNPPELTLDDPASVVDPLPGATIQFSPLVGRFMRAELRGVGFEITPQSPAQQEVIPDSVTTWSWQVVARDGGERALTLTTVIEGCTEDRSECVPLRSTTYNYTVQVAVRPLDRARDFLAGVPDWLKIASGIIAAIAGLIFALVSLRSAVRKAKG